MRIEPIQPIGAFLPVYPVYQPLPVRKKRKVEKPLKKGEIQLLLMEALKIEEAAARRPVPKPVELSPEEILAKRLKQLNIQENYIQYMLMAGIITYNPIV